MNERLTSYDRESVKLSFQKSFGGMLEQEELQKLLGKNQNVDELMANGKLIVLWPGENKPVFPYFQLDKGKLRPEIGLVLQTINEASQDQFYSPRLLCEWFITPIKGYKRLTPKTIMKQGRTKWLVREAQTFGEKISHKSP